MDVATRLYNQKKRPSPARYNTNENVALNNFVSQGQRRDRSPKKMQKEKPVDLDNLAQMIASEMLQRHLTQGGNAADFQDKQNF